MAHDGSLIFDTKIDTSGFTSGIGKLGKVAKKSIGTVTAAIGAAGTALAGLGGAAIRAGINFESAFAGVKKTVNGTEQELAGLREGILDLAGEMPMAADAIAGIAESAGQLGIEKENLLGFTKTMADLGVATNLTGEEAASTLAKFANITGMDQDNFDRLGSTIVALGNNLATTEADIAAMAMRLAGTGKQIGLSEAQILSFAGALSSVGIEAEAGGTAFSKVFKDMQLAVETGNADLQNFATVAGMSAAEFKAAFQKDAAGAILSFIDGLGKSEERGMSVVKVLNDLGITEAHMSDALSRASGAADLFTNALQIGSSAWTENTALTAEAEQRYATMESRLAILKNRVTELGITFYESTNTDISGAVDLLGEYVGEIQTAFESDGLTGAVDAFGDVLGDLAVRLAEAAPGILEAGANLIEKLADSLIENADAVGAAAAKIGTLLVETIQKFIPKLVDLAGEILKGFAKGLGDAIPILKPFAAALELVGNNLKTLTTITVAYIAATKGMQIVSKVSSFLAKASKAATDYARVSVLCGSAQIQATTAARTYQIVIAGLTGKMPLLAAAKALCTKAQLALNAAWTANPVGMVVAGVAALCIAIKGLAELANRETAAERAHREELEALTKADEENLAAINKRREEYTAFCAEQDAKTAAELQEISTTQQLAAELQTLADEDGHVQEAHRARAEYILGELNSAYGLEAKMVDGTIQKYDELQKSIVDAVKAKEAAALMENAQEKYNYAIENIGGAKAEQDANLKALTDSTQKYNEALAECERLSFQIQRAEFAGDLKKVNQLKFDLDAAKRKALDFHAAMQADQANYDASTATVQGYTQDILNYQEASKLVAEKNYDAASSFLRAQTDGLQDATSAQIKYGDDTDAILDELLKTYQSKLSSVADAMRLYSETGSETALQNLLAALGDLEKAASEYENHGGEIANGIAKGANGATLDLNPLLNNIDEYAKKSPSLGQGFADGFIGGIKGEGDSNLSAAAEAGKMMAEKALKALQEGIDSNSPSKETGYLGDDFAAGFVNAIEDGKKNVGAAAQALAEEGLTSIQETQDSHSAAKETRYLGNDFSDGFTAGIEDGVPRAEEAAEKLAESTLNAIKRFVPEGTNFAIDFTEWEISNEGKHALEQLKLQLGIGLITQKEYYRQLEYWRNGYLKKGTQDWWNYTIELAEGREKLAKDEQTNLKNRLSAGLISEAEYYVELERIRDEYLEEGSEAWQGYTDDITEHHKEAFTDIAKEAEKSVDGVIKLQESMEKKLQSVTKAPYDEQKIQVKTKDKKGNEETLSYTKRALHDYAADNETLSTYKDAILAVKERGVPTGLLDVLRDMSVEDGMAFAKLLTEASDEEFAAYIKEWQENQDLSGAIARELYSEETDEAINSFATALKEAGKQVPEGFFDDGKTAADKFGEGFIEQIETVFTKIKGAFSRSLSALTPFQLGGLTGVPFYGGNTNNFSSTVYVSAASPAEAERYKRDTTITNTLGGS